MTRASSPRHLEEALARLAEDPTLLPLAGCTDLLVGAATSPPREGGVLDLTAIEEIRGIREEDDVVEIGATTTFSQIAANPVVKQFFPILAEAASVVGGWQIQNRATLGGNMVNASPAGDSLPVLLALSATAIVGSATAMRHIDYDDFHLGYRQTALGPGELLLRVRLPKQPRREIQHFTKVGTRQAQAISKVVVALAASREDGRLRRVRIAAGSVAATPIRLMAAEAACEGAVPSLDLGEAVCAAARDEVSPIDDIRSSADYRRWALGRVLRRMILSSMGGEST